MNDIFHRKTHLIALSEKYHDNNLSCAGLASPSSVGGVILVPFVEIA